MTKGLFNLLLCHLLVAVFATIAAGQEDRGFAQRIKQAEASVEQGSNFDTTGFDFDIVEGPFKPVPDSFEEQYQCPDWFRDAKFGIYSHWGINSVPGYNGHYARFMYMQHEPQVYQDDLKAKRRKLSGYKPGAENVYNHHTKTYGHPSKFGYKDFIPMWKAEKFDPDELMSLFKQAGAKYFGAMAVHHDNFDNYDSTHHPWNSVKMGPHKDIVGLWKQAAEKEGLRFAVSSHLSNTGMEHLFYQGEADTTGPLKGVPYDTTDAKYNGLYGNRTADRLRHLNPGFARNWYRRTKELVDKYDPDLLYFDGGIPNGDYGYQLAAHFYNQSIQRNGQLEAVLTIKTHRKVRGFIRDNERHNSDFLRPVPWQTDTTINRGWFYLGDTVSKTEDAETMAEAGMNGAESVQKTGDPVLLNSGQVVDNLIDIVSKNGNMMLNVGIRPDGTIPTTYRQVLVEIGQWLQQNGEGIYGTRPFQVFGEGSFELPKKGHKFNDHTYKYTSKDIRFTTKGDVLYAFVLDYPDNQQVTIETLKAGQSHGQVTSVTLLGTKQELSFRQTDAGLVVDLPAEAPNEFACGLKIEGVLKN